VRQKIELVNQAPLIVTVRGAGYMLRLDLSARASKTRGSE
jgi:4-aminobutyrate aminotransferase-like enzyme